MEQQMTTKFAVINPLTGIYTYTETVQERNQLIANLAWAFFLSHTHNEPFSCVTINEDGSEAWRTPTGEERLSPQQIEAMLAEVVTEETQP